VYGYGPWTQRMPGNSRVSNRPLTEKYHFSFLRTLAERGSEKYVIFVRGRLHSKGHKCGHWGLLRGSTETLELGSKKFIGNQSRSRVGLQNVPKHLSKSMHVPSLAQKDLRSIDQHLDPDNVCDAGKHCVDRVDYLVLSNLTSGDGGI
jgi:hypothetical protein